MRFPLLVGLTFFGLMSFCAVSPLWADDISPTLPAIVKEGTPAEVLIEDPVLPVVQGSSQLTGGSGGLEHSMTDELALPMRDTERPGAYSQFRGLGVTAEDNNVQALGIPLNAAQGSGFDFSTFPQYLWSSYRFQLGPSTGSLDPGAVSGTLTLVPWSEQALVDRKAVSRGTVLATDNNLGQVSAASSDGETYAAVLGCSAGDLRGPSGELSTKFHIGNTDARFHLLATDVTGSGRSFDYLASGSTQTTVRFLPVLQLDTAFPAHAELKQSVFYDNQYYASDIPGFGYSNTRAQQIGVENVLLTDEWKLGISAREVFYSDEDLGSLDEGVGSLQITRMAVLGNTIIEPTLQIIGVTDYGFYPQGSLGARSEFENGKLALFYRANYNRKFPTLNDRFVNIAGYFLPNPGLQPETDWTGTAGTEWKSGPLSTGLQVFGQKREDAQVYVTLPGGMLHQYMNVGDAGIVSVLHRVAFSPVEEFQLSNSVTWSSSNIDATGLRIPYLSDVTDVASAGYEVKPVNFSLFGRFATNSEGGTSASTSTTIPGYALFDFEARAVLGTGGEWTLALRIDNLAGRQITIIPGTPLPGRVLSVLLIATL